MIDTISFKSDRSEELMINILCRSPALAPGVIKQDAAVIAMPPMISSRPCRRHPERIINQRENVVLWVFPFGDCALKFTCNRLTWPVSNGDCLCALATGRGRHLFN